MNTHLETRRNTREKTSNVYGVNYHFIINLKLDILKMALLLIKDYNFKIDVIY